MQIRGVTVCRKVLVKVQANARFSHSERRACTSTCDINTMNTVLQKYRIDTVITACRLVYTYEVRIACDCMHSQRLLYMYAQVPDGSFAQSAAVSHSCATALLCSPTVMRVTCSCSLTARSNNNDVCKM
jgi:hypothetical protein